VIKYIDVYCLIL